MKFDMGDCMNYVLFADVSSDIYLAEGEKNYRLSTYPAEPCLYIHLNENKRITVHNAFTTGDIYRAIQTNGRIRMITGNAYDVTGICRLLAEAVKLNEDSVDIAYLEGCCVMRRLEETGAISERSAMALTDENVKNQNIMNRLIRSGQVCKTDDGRYYVPGV